VGCDIIGTMAGDFFAFVQEKTSHCFLAFNWIFLFIVAILVFETSWSTFPAEHHSSSMHKYPITGYREATFNRAPFSHNNQRLYCFKFDLPFAFSVHTFLSE
jgi:hypothetical protein